MQQVQAVMMYAHFPQRGLAACCSPDLLPRACNTAACMRFLDHDVLQHALLGCAFHDSLQFLHTYMHPNFD